MSRPECLPIAEAVPGEPASHTGTRPLPRPLTPGPPSHKKTGHLLDHEAFSVGTGLLPIRFWCFFLAGTRRRGAGRPSGGTGGADGTHGTHAASSARGVTW